MRNCLSCLVRVAFLAAALFVCSSHAGFEDHESDLEAMPTVPDGFQIELVAREPFVSNPCAMAFDVQGRLCVGMGPQYRKPKPDTPGDSVWILTDSDGDGKFDKKHRFATGFNSIQSIAWHGDDLWVANAPDLTVVRDTDGDEVADKYTRIYTDLGNLEHGLHGLTWGPDGRLYMSKGNSKGHTSEGRLAPKPFRELWGVKAEPGAPDFPEPVVSGADDYKRAFHHPRDDWGREGGVLVCDANGENLEIVSRGFRNPWDIAHDDEFNWQGTDNDQDEGDRIFTPFRNSHYGWGHSWSAHWTGKDHLPTAPITGPVFHGSGTGITFYNAKQFPKSHRRMWFFNDWLNQTTYCYHAKWDGALMQPEGGKWQEFVVGGKALYRPTDIEVGPDGALYILGWGREYGVQWNDDKEQVNEGRIYRVSWKSPKAPAETAGGELDWSKPLEEWQAMHLMWGFESPVASRRVAAQLELLRRGGGSSHLFSEGRLINHKVKAETKQGYTWFLFTWAQMHDAVGLIGHETLSEPFFHRTGVRALGERLRRESSMAALGRVKSSDEGGTRPRAAMLHETSIKFIVDALQADDPTVRSASLQSLHPTWVKRCTAKQRELIKNRLIGLIVKEQDRVCFYQGWQTLRENFAIDELNSLLVHDSGKVRLAGLLALAEDRLITDEQAEELLKDDDASVREIAAMWMAKRNGSELLTFNEPSQEFVGELELGVDASVKPAEIYYTTDGSTPDKDSQRWDEPVIDKTTTVKVALYSHGKQIGPIAELQYKRLGAAKEALRVGILRLRAESGEKYRAAVGGFAKGKPVYADRRYRFESVPDELEGLTAIQCSNEDAGSHGSGFLRFESVVPTLVYVGHDRRIEEKPKWFERFGKTSLRVTTEDSEFDIYQREFPAGDITLGGNTVDQEDADRSNYLVALKQLGLQVLPEQTTVEQAMKALPKANSQRGRALFFAEGAATCSTCHQAEEGKLGYGPNLANLVKRNDPEYIVRSMLEPSAHITEGYKLQIVQTEDGKTVSGLLQSQTDAGITLAQPELKSIFIPTGEIESRQSADKSPMPVFDRLLNPQQVADVTAWLIAHEPAAPEADDSVETEAESAEPQRNPVQLDSDSARFEIEEKDGRLDVRLNGHAFGTYLFEHEKLTRPAWTHLNSHNGIPLTREFPAEDDDADHRFMHPGIWISFGHLDGEDFWRMKSRTKHVAFVDPPKASGGKAGFTIKNQYLRKESDEVVCEETTRYDLRTTKQGVVLNVDARFQSERDFYFGDQEESGLAFRMHGSLRVDEGGAGKITNSQGDVNGKAAWGKQSKWVNYSGVLSHGGSDRHAGILVVPHPENARECWMHARDYGLVALVPFPRRPKGAPEPATKTWVRKGETYRVRYAVLLHDTAEGIDLKRTAEGLR